MAKKFESYFNDTKVLYNPTKQTISLTQNSRTIELEPGETMEISSATLWRWFLKNYAYKGLVDLTWDEKAKAKYGTPEKHKHAMALESLKNLHKQATLSLAREQQAANESSLSSNAPLDKLGFKVKYFEAAIEEIEKDIESLMQKPNESRADQNKGKEKAG